MREVAAREKEADARMLEAQDNHILTQANHDKVAEETNWKRS